MGPTDGNWDAGKEEIRVPFGAGKTQVMPVEWAAWILTTMRDDELNGRKARKFSDLLAAAAMAAK